MSVADIRICKAFFVKPWEERLRCMFGSFMVNCLLIHLSGGKMKNCISLNIGDRCGLAAPRAPKNICNNFAETWLKVFCRVSWVWGCLPSPSPPRLSMTENMNWGFLACGNYQTGLLVVDLLSSPLAEDEGITNGVLVAGTRMVLRDVSFRNWWMMNGKNYHQWLKRVRCVWQWEPAADMKQWAPRCLYASLSHLDYASRHGAGGEMEGSIHRLRSLPFPTAIPLHYLQEASLARYLNKQTRPHPPPQSETQPRLCADENMFWMMCWKVMCFNEILV